MRESGFDSACGHRSGHADTPPDAGVWAAPWQGSKVSPGPFRKFMERSFYLSMSLLVAAVVIFGFSHTIGANLLAADTPRPAILYVHAMVFSGWVVLFITQSALVRSAHVTWHRRLGMFGGALGAALPVVGIATALVMQHWHAQREGGSAASLSLPFNDMLTFAIAFGLAMYWRRRPEFHRRLMLLATCCLTGAAFARFPTNMVPDSAFYACVDLLILLGVLRDLIVLKRVHAVYRYGLPLMATSQALAQYLIYARPALWMEATQRVMQWTA
jgi:hypothetical protein